FPPACFKLDASRGTGIGIVISLRGYHFAYSGGEGFSRRSLLSQPGEAARLTQNDYGLWTLLSHGARSIPVVGSRGLS
ncbi:MAG TPA: hypothetical protein VH593_31800, partial [Ktedonobacteraceae bacterium]